MGDARFDMHRRVSDIYVVLLRLLLLVLLLSFTGSAQLLYDRRGSCWFWL